MITKSAGIFLLVLALSMSSFGTILAGSQFGQRSFVEYEEVTPNELIVKFKQGVDSATVSAVHERLRGRVLGRNHVLGFERVRIAQGSVSDLVEAYNNNPYVEYAEPNYIAHALFVPNDSFYSYQWHFDNTDFQGIHMQDAWDSSNGSGVVVAVIDTGVAYENYGVYGQAPDLANTSFAPGYDFVNNDTHPNDDQGHGTHVAGTIAQSTNNNLGVAGGAYGATIMPVKVLNKYGSGSYDQVANGIIWAADNNADVINLSLGGTATSQTMLNAVAYAYGKGVTILAAAGNSASSAPHYPSGHNDYVISVGATRYDETLSYYSNYGSDVDVVAPGGDLNIDQNGDGYGDGVLQQTLETSRFGRVYTNRFGYYFYQGTSMATPHGAAVAALILAQGVASTPDEVRHVLQSTADDLGASGRDDMFGWGLINAAAALGSSASTPSPDPDPGPEPDPEPENIAPVADAGGPYNSMEGEAILFDGSSSYDPEGEPMTYDWDFGDGVNGTGINPSHTYSSSGTYEVTLVVSDGALESPVSVTSADVAPIPEAQEGLIYEEDFESGLGAWTQDSQRDWFISSQRSIDGSYSAEVDGRAQDSQLISPVIVLNGSSATVSFSWYIERRVDRGEYLAFDISLDSGVTWTERARLQGNEDQEDVWHNVAVDIGSSQDVQLRFRAKMSSSSEDANVDALSIVAY